MAISRVKTWTTNEDLTSSDLNSEFNQVMNNAANTGSAETISARYTFSAGVILDELVATNAAGAGNIKISEFRWDPASGTAADGDGMYIDWVADDAGGTETIMARTGVELTDTDASGEDSEFEIHTMIGATLTKVASFGSAGTTFNTAVTVGVDDTGKDVKFFGATSGQYMLWDESADELVLAGDSKLSFHDAAGGENIVASADGHLEINAGTTLDITATTIDLNGAVAMNGATTGGTNITISGELDAATLDISGNADIDGTLEADAYTVDGTALNEYIADTVGAMVTSNTETNIAVTYQDGDNTLDFAISSIDGTAIGASTPSTGAFTSLSATTDVSVGDDLLFTSSGAVINFNSSDITITHAANALRFAGGDFSFGGTTYEGTHIVSVEESNDGGDTAAIIYNSAGAGSTDETASLWLQPGPTSGLPGIQAYRMNNGSTAADRDYGLKFWVSDSNSQALAMTIEPESGRVGIGDASPLMTLHVNSGTTNDAALFESTDSQVTINFKDNNTTADNSCRIYVQGNDMYLNTRESGSKLTFETANTGRLTIDGDGKVGIGTSSPEYQLSVKEGTGTNTVHIDSSGGTGGSSNILLESDRPGSSSGQEGGKIKFYNQGGSGADYAQIAGLVVSDTTGMLQFSTDGSARMTIDTGGMVGIGETDPNGLLSLNQGADSTVILTCKTSTGTYNTGLTTGTLAVDVESDDFLAISKVDANTGGAYIQAIGETGRPLNMLFESYGGAPVTTDTSSSTAAMAFFVGLHNGSNDLSDMAGDSNGFAWGEITSADARVTRMLLKADDGELHLGNTTLVALDEHDDNQIVRAMQKTGSSSGIIESEHDNPFYDYRRLCELGLAGEMDEEGFFLFPLQSRLHAHEGAMWQTYCAMQELKKVVARQSEELAEARKEIKQLAA